MLDRIRAWFRPQAVDDLHAIAVALSVLAAIAVVQVVARLFPKRGD